jgi:hypothetical protein
VAAFLSIAAICSGNKVAGTAPIMPEPQACPLWA